MRISEVAKLTGITVRTLHYYDEIGLLKPSEITEAGYRLYSREDLEILQQILFFRELDFPLSQIKEIMNNFNYDKEEALIMSDKIAVMVNGKIEQFDKPETLYQKPRTKSVANIFGERNYIKGKIENEVFKSNILYIDAKGYNNLDIVEAMIPKECIKLYSSNYNDGINGYIQRKQYVGDKTFYDININGEVLKCTSISNEYNQGDCVKICVDRDNIVFFPL